MDSSKINLLKGSNLLLVEDDNELRNSLKEILSIFFKKVFTAKDGLEALEIYTNNIVNLIITDYVMPIKNGYEFVKEIREKNRKIPIVIMSNHSDTEKLLNSITLELTDYVIKPVEYKQLLDTLIKMAEKLERENILYFNINENKRYNFLKKELFDEKDGTVTKLSKSEIIILELFLNNINKIVSLESIEYNLSPTEHKSEQAIKNIIHRLRTKLSSNSISNVQGVGYIYKIEK